MQTTPLASNGLPQTSSSRIEWIDTLRVLFMIGVFAIHTGGGAGMSLYSKVATYGYLMLAGYLFARPGASLPLFPIKKIAQVFIIYVFWIVALKYTYEGIRALANPLIGIPSTPLHIALDRAVPTWKEFTHPYGTDLTHMWWLKSYLLVICMGGILHRLPTSMLVLFTLVCLGVNDLNLKFLDEPVFLRPVVPGFFGLGMLLSRLPREKVEELAGARFPKAALALFLVLPFVLLALVQYDVIKYYPFHNSSMGIALFILLLALSSRGVERLLPGVQKLCSRLAPSLMIFYILHVAAIMLITRVHKYFFDTGLTTTSRFVAGALTFALFYGVYLLITRYCPPLCYLLLCKPRRKAAATPKN